MWNEHKKSQSRVREQQKMNEWIDWLQVIIIDQLLFFTLSD